jgi:hypothetical protein
MDIAIYFLLIWVILLSRIFLNKRSGLPHKSFLTVEKGGLDW